MIPVQNNIPMISENIVNHTNVEICETSSRKFEMDPELLITRLSFSHIKEILALDDAFERFNRIEFIYAKL